MTPNRKHCFMTRLAGRLSPHLVAIAILGSAWGMSGCGDDMLAAEASTGCPTLPGTPSLLTGTQSAPTGAEPGPANCDQLPGNDRCSTCLKGNCCEALRRCYEDSRGCGCYAQCNIQAPGGIASSDAIACVFLRGCTTPNLNLLGQVLNCGRQCAATGSCKLADLPSTLPGTTSEGTGSTKAESSQTSTSTSSTQETSSSSADSTTTTSTQPDSTQSTTQETTSSQTTNSTNATTTQSTTQSTTSTTQSSSAQSTTTQASTSQATNPTSGAQSSSSAPGSSDSTSSGATSAETTSQQPNPTSSSSTTTNAVRHLSDKDSIRRFLYQLLGVSA